MMDVICFHITSSNKDFFTFVGDEGADLMKVASLMSSGLEGS